MLGSSEKFGKNNGPMLQDYKRGRSHICDPIPGFTPAPPPSQTTAWIPLVGESGEVREKQ
ncbi:hypothetical protein A2U01_0063853 [Trifolium medium]|uniref:Uncharacterized protein n=1 Tax=Trifolium medium TaxID=97028 RepID=A0A392S414_9FABA|nr:hypothetical protein [Trifolium medium]